MRAVRKASLLWQAGDRICLVGNVFGREERRAHPFSTWLVYPTRGTATSKPMYRLFFNHSIDCNRKLAFSPDGTSQMSTYTRYLFILLGVQRHMYLRRPPKYLCPIQESNPDQENCQASYSALAGRRSNLPGWQCFVFFGRE